MPKRIKICDNSEIDSSGQVDETSKLHEHHSTVSNGQCEVDSTVSNGQCEVDVNVSKDTTNIEQRDENEENNLTSVVNTQHVQVDTTAKNRNIDHPITEVVGDESIIRKSSPNNSSHIVQPVRQHNAVNVTFSDDENSGDDSDTVKLVSQINRIQSYLKKDRLKRTK